MADPAAFAADITEVTGTYTLTATAGSLPAHAPSGQTYTAFTGELLGLLTAGIPQGPAELTLGVIYPHLRQRLTARGLPRPQQRGTDTIDQLALVRNPAHIPPDPAAHTPEGASRRPAPPSIDDERVANSYRRRLLAWWLPLRGVAIRRRRELVTAMASIAALGGASFVALSDQTPLSVATPPEAAPVSEAPASSSSGVTQIWDIYGPACSQVLPTEGEGSARGMVDDPVATAASNNPLLTTLVKAVTAAQLGDTLNSAEAITVFAPADTAFQGLETQSPDTINQLTTDPNVASVDSQLATILKYHVVGQRYDLAGLVEAGMVETLQGGQ
ncbi:MAG: fasciclin domain-containing protein, partial [Pseudonocardiaceae bacterium]